MSPEYHQVLELINRRHSKQAIRVLQQNPNLLHEIDKTGQSILFKAVIAGDTAIVDALLTDQALEGFDADSSDHLGRNILDVALDCGHIELANTLDVTLSRHRLANQPAQTIIPSKSYVQHRLQSLIHRLETSRSPYRWAAAATIILTAGVVFGLIYQADVETDQRKHGELIALRTGELPKRSSDRLNDWIVLAMSSGVRLVDLRAESGVDLETTRTIAFRCIARVRYRDAEFEADIEQDQNNRPVWTRVFNQGLPDKQKMPADFSIPLQRRLFEISREICYD